MLETKKNIFFRKRCTVSCRKDKKEQNTKLKETLVTYYNRATNDILKVHALIKVTTEAGNNIELDITC